MYYSISKIVFSGLRVIEYGLLRRVLYKLTKSDNVHVMNQDFKETKRYDILIFY